MKFNCYDRFLCGGKKVLHVNRGRRIKWKERNNFICFRSLLFIPKRRKILLLVIGQCLGDSNLASRGGRYKYKYIYISGAHSSP